jgi:MYXO-CTERM domain-containing protein
MVPHRILRRFFSMRRASFTGFAAALVGICLSAPAHASILHVGDSGVSPDTFGAVSGTVLASQTVSGSSSVLDVSVFEQVIRDSVTGHLDFKYTVTNKPSSTDGVSRVTVSNFGKGPFGSLGPWTLDVGYDSTTSGATPSTVDRPNSSHGNVIGWDFGSFDSGQTSVTLVVKTNADNYESGKVAVIDGQSVNLTGFQPGPEPSSMVLAGLGAVGLVAYGLRRRKARTA